MNTDNMRNIYKEFKSNQQIFRVLESSKALADSILDELPVSLILVDQDQKILKLNQTAQGVFHRIERETLGTPLQNLIPGGVPEQMKDYFSRESDFGKQFVFEQAIEIETKTVFLFWQICMVFIDRDGRTVHALLGNDITEARNALESLVVVRKDLEVASAVQNTLLPPQHTFENKQCNLAGYYEPAAQVGGDLWWYRDFPNATLVIVLDVMGHGAGSAMVTAILSGAMSVLGQGLSPEQPAEMERFLTTLHETVTSTCKGRIMVCLSALVVLKGSPSAHVYNLGFPSSYLQKATGESVSVLAPGSPIGLHETPFSLGFKEFEFLPGDRYTVFTDGCYEFDTAENRSFGRAKFCRMLLPFGNLTPNETVQNVGAQLAKLRGKPFADDDITIVVVDRK